MADLALLANANVGAVYKRTAVIRSCLAGEAIAEGDLVVYNSSDKVVKADASVAGTAEAIGVALDAVGTDQVTSVIFNGEVAGFDLSSIDAGTVLFVSDTAGKIADAAGTVSKRVGKVTVVTEHGNPRRVARVELG